MVRTLNCSCLILFLLCPELAKADEVPARAAAPTAAALYRKAEERQLADSYAEAAECWKEFLDHFPDDCRAPLARHNRAVCLWKTGKLDEAAAECEELLASADVYGQKGEVRLLLGLVRLEQARARPGPGPYRAAAAAFEAVRKEHRGTSLASRAALYRAEALAEAGEAEAAAEALEQLLRDEPRHESRDRALYSLGVLREQRRELPEAARQFQQFLAAFSKHELAPEVRLRLGEVRQAQGETTAAEQAYAAAAADPHFVYADRAVLRRAECLEALHRPGDAAALLAGLAEQFPRSPLVDEARARAARIHLEAGRPEEARTVLAPTADREEAPPDAALLYGIILRRLDRPADAEKILDDLLRQAPDYPRRDQVLYERARAVAAHGSAAEAAAAYERLEERPDSPLLADALYRAGCCHAQAHAYPDAVRCLEAALPEARDGVLKQAVRFQLGWCLLRQGQAGRAAGHFELLARDFPDGAQAPAFLYYAGKSNEAAGQDARAADCFAKAVQRGKSPYRAAAGIAAGQAELRRNRPGDAARHFRQVLDEEGPTSPRADEARLGLALAHRDLGEPDKALALCEEIVAAGRGGGPQARAAFLRALLLKEDYKLREAAQAFDDIAAHYGEAEVCGDALFEAGLLFEALEAGRARTCYGTLVTKYPHHPRAADAAVRLKRLGR